MGLIGLAARWRRELCAGISGGLLMALSFPPFASRYLVLVALVPVFHYYLRDEGFARRGEGFSLPSGGGSLATCFKRGFVLGFVLGLSFFTVLLYWVANLIPESSARMPWLMIPSVILLVLYLSCYPALFTGLLSVMFRHFGRRALLAAPALWALAELARSRGELGFSWGGLPYSLAVFPPAVQGLSVYGPFGLSMILVAVNCLITSAFFGATRRCRLWSVLTAAVIIGAHIVWGFCVIARYDRVSEGVDRGRRVAVVQPNVDLGIKWKPAFRDSIFTQIEKAMLEAASGGAELVIFPETSAPVSLRHSNRYLQWLKHAARGAKAEMLIGYVDHITAGNGWLSFNAAGLIKDDGALVAQYEKVNLLPFGERMPFSQYLPFLNRMDFGQANFTPGGEATVFVSDPGRFGVLICFESTFSGLTRGYVREGADFLVNITNDGWFGSSRGPIQHAEMAILRSVENRVVLFRAANTGVSMVVDPVGRVKARIGLDSKGIIFGQADSSRRPSFYARNGHLVFYIMALISLAVTPAAGIFVRRG